MRVSSCSPRSLRVPRDLRRRLKRPTRRRCERSPTTRGRRSIRSWPWIPATATSRTCSAIADRLRALLPVELVESAPGRGNLVARYKGTGRSDRSSCSRTSTSSRSRASPGRSRPSRSPRRTAFSGGAESTTTRTWPRPSSPRPRARADASGAVARRHRGAHVGGRDGGGPGAQWLAENHKDLSTPEIALNEGGGTLLTTIGSRS